jgi:trans-aconitate 2-methyltransferase
MPQWDAKQYLKFADERTQAARDLVARIEIDHPRRIIDLGCGPGNSTAILCTRWPAAEVIGLDSSPEMIEAASRSYPSVKWVLADAETWTTASPFDIVFSNAALQWVPHHARLLPRLLAQVAAGGVLAVQIPAHHRSRSHQVILEAADDPEWRHLMAAARSAMTRETPGFYYNVLQPLTSHLTLWETEYYHVLDGPQAMLEWFRGTGLRPYLAALENDQQRRRFQEKLIEGFEEIYPRQPDGRVLFPFCRLFLMARR